MKLSDFCSNGFEPFSSEAYTYFSDGKIVVRVPRLKEVEVHKSYGKTSDGFPWFGHSGLKDIPEILPIKWRECVDCVGSGYSDTCGECDGEGEISSHSYSVECKSCNGQGAISGGKTICTTCSGRGKVMKKTGQLLDGGYFDVKYLNKIACLPGVKYKTINKTQMYFVFGENICGLLQGMV